MFRCRQQVCIVAHSNASATLERQRVSIDEAAALSREAFRKELEALNAKQPHSRRQNESLQLGLEEDAQTTLDRNESSPAQASYNAQVNMKYTLF